MSNDVSTETVDLFPQPDIATIEFTSVLKALSDPVRLSIVRRLRDDEFHPCAAEEYDVGVHKSTLSYHFKALREAGITSTLVTGREHAVKLRRAELDAAFPGLLTTVFANTKDRA